MIDLLVSALAFILLMLVAGNNLAISSGSIISGRIVGRNLGIIITIVGYIAGLLIQGTLLRSGFYAIMPLNSATLVTIALLVATVIFIIGYKLRVPQSLAIIFTMALVGISLAYNHTINIPFVAVIIAFWIAAPFVSLIVTMLSMKGVTRALRKQHIWPTLKWIKAVLIITSFLTAFTIGANTFGLLYVATIPYTSIWIMIAAIVLGSFAMSKGTLKRIGDEILPIRYLNALISQSVAAILVELATLSSVPFSNTQAFTAGLYGAGLSYRVKLLLKKPTLVIVFTWVVTAIISFALGYLITLFVA